MASREDSFGGRAGDVVARAVSPAGLITGVLLAVLLAAAVFVSAKTGSTQLAPIAGAIIGAGFLARAAVDAYEAKWSAGRSVPFAEFMPVALRYLALYAVLFIPLVFVGWRPEIAASPSPAGLLIFLLYISCMPGWDHERWWWREASPLFSLPEHRFFCWVSCAVNLRDRCGRRSRERGSSRRCRFRAARQPLSRRP